MQELINQIVQKTGIPADKAQEVLQTVSTFLSEKFPQFAGPLQSALGGEGKGGDTPSGGVANLMEGVGTKLGF